MRTLYKVSSGMYDYELARDRTGWWLVRSDGWEFPLDHDRRHQRLFLRETDERFVGIDGISALEKMTRAVLSREPGS